MKADEYWEKRCRLAERIMTVFMKDYMTTRDQDHLRKGLDTADLLVYGEHQHLVYNEYRKENL